MARRRFLVTNESEERELADAIASELRQRGYDVMMLSDLPDLKGSQRLGMSFAEADGRYVISVMDEAGRRRYAADDRAIDVLGLEQQLPPRDKKLDLIVDRGRHLLFDDIGLTRPRVVSRRPAVSAVDGVDNGLVRATCAAATVAERFDGYPALMLMAVDKTSENLVTPAGVLESATDNWAVFAAARTQLLDYSNPDSTADARRFERIIEQFDVADALEHVITGDCHRFPVDVVQQPEFVQRARATLNEEARRGGTFGEVMDCVTFMAKFWKDHQANLNASLYPDWSRAWDPQSSLTPRIERCIDVLMQQGAMELFGSPRTSRWTPTDLVAAGAASLYTQIVADLHALPSGGRVPDTSEKRALVTVDVMQSPQNRQRLFDFLHSVVGVTSPDVAVAMREHIDTFEAELAEAYKNRGHHARAYLVSQKATPTLEPLRLPTFRVTTPGTGITDTAMFDAMDPAVWDSAVRPRPSVDQNTEVDDRTRHAGRDGRENGAAFATPVATKRPARRQRPLSLEGQTAEPTSDRRAESLLQTSEGTPGAGLDQDRARTLPAESPSATVSEVDTTQSTEPPATGLDI